MSVSTALSSIVQVLFIDNDPLVRLGAKALLNQQPGWVVRSTGDCVSAIDLCVTYKPNIILLGVNNVIDTDIESIQTLKRLHIPIMAYGSTTDLGDMHKLLAAGADSFIHRSVSSESLIQAIHGCIQGRQTVLTGNENSLLYSLLRTTVHPVNKPSLLTSRENDVLICVQQGMSNAEIAAQLNITAGTVKAHISHLMRKHGVSSRTKLAIKAVRHSHEN